MKSYRQGDVLLIEVSEVKGDPIKPTARGHVLAHGEVTGHAHTIERKKARYTGTPEGKRFVALLEDTSLKHEEHGAILLRKGGKLIQAFQVEDYGTEVRRVAD